MNKRKIRGAMGLGLFLCLALGGQADTTALAESVTPGSQGDPLVSKSYVDQKINQIMNLIGTGGVAQPVQPTAPAQAFEPVSAVAGQIVVGGEGAEIILRSGKGVGYCAGGNGLVDVTSGIELFNGYEVQVNHLILVPRNDGRGVKVTADAWFIIKGEYYILN